MIILVSLLKDNVWSMHISKNVVTNFFCHGDVINMQIRSDVIISVTNFIKSQQKDVDLINVVSIIQIKVQ